MGNSEEHHEWTMTRDEAARERYDEMVAEIKAPLEERIQALEERWDALKELAKTYGLFDDFVKGRIAWMMAELEGK